MLQCSHISYKSKHVCGWGVGGGRLGTKMLTVVLPGC